MPQNYYRKANRACRIIDESLLWEIIIPKLNGVMPLVFQPVNFSNVSDQENYMKLIGYEPCNKADYDAYVSDFFKKSEDLRKLFNDQRQAEYERQNSLLQQNQAAATGKG